MRAGIARRGLRELDGAGAGQGRQGTHRSHGNKIYFTGTNLDTTIKTSIDVNEVIREGEVAFYYSIIDEYLKEIKDEFIKSQLFSVNKEETFVKVSP